MPEKSITLLTDFGNIDPYVAIMKGVITTIAPGVSVIDISHEIPAHDVFFGALMLKASYQWFPAQTIHLAVVDPGVGGARKPILIQTEKYFFLGPDNGLLSLALEKENILHMFELKEVKYFLPKVSHTFHGRDIFAPCAAWLSRGVSPSSFGPEINEIVKLNMPEFSVEKDIIKGYVISSDRFGNIITNIPEEIAVKSLRFTFLYNVIINSKTYNPRFVKTYSDAVKGELCLLIGSLGYLEIAANTASARLLINCQIGDAVWIKLKESS